MKENILFYIGLCGAIPFLVVQMCAIGAFVRLHLKTYGDNKGGKLSSFLLAELTCMVIWLAFSRPFNRHFIDKQYWFFTHWKIIMFCLVVMMSSRCMGLIVVWGANRTKS